MTLARLLADAAARFPDRPALISTGVTATFAELDGRAARAAGAFVRLGVGRGDRVAFMLSNTAESVAAFHGMLRLGAVPVPLNPLLSEHEIRGRVRESGATLLTVDDLDGDPLADSGPPPAPNDVAVILYTSGSTGRPKRIELTHGGLRLSADATASALGLNQRDVLLGAPPLSHVFGMTGCMNASIAAGACLLLLPRFDATSALAMIERHRVTVLMGVPAMCVSLLTASNETGSAPSLRLAHVGGAPLPPATRHAFEERFGARVLVGYGMTEAGGAVAIQRADRPAKPDSVGPALVGELRIADEGEVLVRAPTLARGIDGWLPTGDIGRLDDDGDLFLLDRKKNIVLRGGYTVYPREVEEALIAHPAVREAVVVGIPHATLGEEVAAIVVADHPCDPDELKTFVRERLAAYKYPRLIELVAQLPYGATGKIERKTARELLGTRERPAP